MFRRASTICTDRADVPIFHRLDRRPDVDGQAVCSIISRPRVGPASSSFRCPQFLSRVTRVQFPEVGVDKSKKVVVCGGGGFIGGHLVADLLKRGHKNVRCVDVKPMDQWYQVHGDADNIVADLNLLEHCRTAVKDTDVVINLACNMGGMGFIENNKGLCMVSVLINTHLLQAAKEKGGVDRFFYASSACVYNGDKQKEKKI